MSRRPAPAPARVPRADEAELPLTDELLRRLRESGL